MFFQTRCRLPATICFALLAGAATIGLSGPASAGDRLYDQVYADSFGNLVIQSPYGYKRIIVGRGYLAEKFSGLTGGNDPKVVYAEPEGGFYGDGFVFETCYRPAVLLRGRSYMYGLPDRVLPEPSGHCRRR